MSDPLPTEAHFIVIPVLREEVEVNVVSALGQEGLQVLKRENINNKNLKLKFSIISNITLTSCVKEGLSFGSESQQ